MIRPLVLAFALATIGLPVLDAEPEHWACSDMGFKPPVASHWTIVEGWMFGRGGKGYLTVVQNTQGVMVAYQVLSKPRYSFSSAVNVINKVVGSCVSYNDIVASGAVHYSDEQPEPESGKVRASATRCLDGQAPPSDKPPFSYVGHPWGPAINGT